LIISKEFVDYEIDKLEKCIKSGKKVDNTSFILILADLQMASPNYEINRESYEYKKIKQLMGRQR
jgi:hypothetical protein